MSAAPNYLARRLRQARWHRVDDELARRTVGCRARLLSTCALVGARPQSPRRLIKGPRGVTRKQLSGSLLKGPRRF
jgi:hypothetical protein